MTVNASLKCCKALKYIVFGLFSYPCNLIHHSAMTTVWSLYGVVAKCIFVTRVGSHSVRGGISNMDSFYSPTVLMETHQKTGQD